MRAPSAAIRGRADVIRRLEKFNSALTLIEGKELEAELVAHYSRYLCVLLSGVIEQSTKELVIEYARRRSSPQLHRYVQAQLRLLRNIDEEKLRKLIQSLETSWWTDLEDDYFEEIDAIRSVAGLRNSISHGGDSGITIVTVRQYYRDASKLLRALCDLLDPEQVRESA
ncbi:HEPN domain-containing protein [Jiangella endophytica]|uniref:HEPN domain-containing protein n=1 Tax=Jiangella endophytica TaxID=1623398 RepID=UPI001300B0DD